MKPASFGQHQTRLIGAPVDWDPIKHGECGALSVHDWVDDHGHPWMVSRWELDEGDLEKLQAGAAFHLSILGQVHPVVYVYVGDPPPKAQPTDATAGTNPGENLNG